MVVVLRKHGFRVVIWPNDHLPAHVHVKGDGLAKIDIATGRVLHHTGMNQRELARAVAVVKEHRDQLLEDWRRFHG